MVRFLLYRPIAVLITAFSVVCLGLLAFTQIPVSLLPEIAIPQITVQVSYPNTAARELHKAIVKPLKNGLLQVNHLEDLTAESRDGLAVIRLSFDYGTNINLAYIETNEKIDALMGILSNAYIGNELNVSPHTIKNHKENIKKKLKVDSCQELLMLAVENSKKE